MTTTTPAAGSEYAANAHQFDLVAHLHRQRDFSARTFGPGARTAGVVDHIRKELKEIEADPSDIMEWVDVIILAFDGAWRAGWEPEAIVHAIVAKQTKNEGRVWPDWRTAPADKAIEHDRSSEATALDSTATLAARVAELEGGVIGEIAAERRRLIEVEGWTPEHNDKHRYDEMALAASAYAMPHSARRVPFPYGGTLFDRVWPWDRSWWKPTDRRRDLIKAAAFILAEIERLDRARREGGDDGR